MRILLVEDDEMTAEFISRAFRAEGFVAEVLRDGASVLNAITSSVFDAVVMDIMLPGKDGLSILREMRALGNRTPVLLLSARGDVGQRVEGLNAGADDFLAKPFVLEELIARLRALARRGSEAKAMILHVADLTLDTTTRVAHRGGRSIELTTREYRLLEFLMRSTGRICARMMILEKVWDYDFDPGSNIVDVYVRKLRDKIDSGFEPKLLHSVRGVGYVMKES
jgi:DNA-binding response OmpR family regulator